MAAATGNQYATNARVWKAALERALDKRGAGNRMVALDALAEKLLSKCDEADMTALREFGDRMDGKPAAAIDLGSDPNRPVLVQEVIRRIVNADN